MRKRTCVVRAGSALISLLVVANSALAAVAESNLWAERQADRASGNTQLASLPALLSQMPRPGSALLLSKPAPAPLLPAGHDAALAALVHALPYGNGTVRSISMPASGKPAGVVVHVQDVHMNAEAQANIGAALSAITAAAPVDFVALEGAFGPMDLSRFQRAPYADATRVVADHLFSENRISGAVHAALSHPMPPLVGIDDRAAYDANVAAIRAAAPARAAAEAPLTAARTALAAEKAATFNDNLLALDRTVSGYRDGTVSLSAYLEALSYGRAVSPALTQVTEALRAEAGLDLPKIEGERTRLVTALVPALTKDDVAALLDGAVALRLGTASPAAFYAKLSSLCDRHGVALEKFPHLNGYIRYVLLADKLDIDRVMADAAALEKSVLSAAARTDAERALLARSDAAGLTGKLLEFSLSETEWTSYLALRAKAPAVGDLTAFEDFYRHAVARDAHMADNLLAAVRAKPGVTAVLVTGGFHARGIDRRLAAANIAVVNFVPKLTKVDGSGSEYMSVFLQDKAPLEKLFEGERLFVAPLQKPNLAILGVEVAATAAHLAGNPGAFDAALRALAPVVPGRFDARVDLTPTDAVTHVASRRSDAAMAVSLHYSDVNVLSRITASPEVLGGVALGALAVAMVAMKVSPALAAVVAMAAVVLAVSPLRRLPAVRTAMRRLDDFFAGSPAPRNFVPRLTRLDERLQPAVTLPKPGEISVAAQLGAPVAGADAVYVGHPVEQTPPDLLRRAYTFNSIFFGWVFDPAVGGYVPDVGVIKPGDPSRGIDPTVRGTLSLLPPAVGDDADGFDVEREAAKVLSAGRKDNGVTVSVAEAGKFNFTVDGKPGAVPVSVDEAVIGQIRVVVDKTTVIVMSVTDRGVLTEGKIDGKTYEKAAFYKALRDLLILKTSAAPRPARDGGVLTADIPGTGRVTLDAETGTVTVTTDRGTEILTQDDRRYEILVKELLVRSDRVRVDVTLKPGRTIFAARPGPFDLETLASAVGFSAGRGGSILKPMSETAVEVDGRRLAALPMLTGQFVIGFGLTIAAMLIGGLPLQGPALLAAGLGAVLYLAFHELIAHPLGFLLSGQPFGRAGWINTSGVGLFSGRLTPRAQAMTVLAGLLPLAVIAVTTTLGLTAPDLFLTAAAVSLAYSVAMLLPMKRLGLSSRASDMDEAITNGRRDAEIDDLAKRIVDAARLVKATGALSDDVAAGIAALIPIDKLGLDGHGLTNLSTPDRARVAAAVKRRLIAAERNGLLSRAQARAAVMMAAGTAFGRLGDKVGNNNLALDVEAQTEGDLDLAAAVIKVTRQEMGKGILYVPVKADLKAALEARVQAAFGGALHGRIDYVVSDDGFYTEHKFNLDAFLPAVGVTSNAYFAMRGAYTASRGTMDRIERSGLKLIVLAEWIDGLLRAAEVTREKLEMMDELAKLVSTQA